MNTEIKKTVYILGHRNPDTDSVVSAAAYARLKHAMGKTECVAVRGGKVTPQTEYIFNRFKVPIPQFIPDMIPKAGYYMHSCRYVVVGDTSLWNGVTKIEETSIKILPVVDAEGTYISLLHYNAFARNILKVMNPETATVFSTNIRLVAETLSAQQLIAFNAEELFKCIIIVVADNFETFKKTLSLHTPENAVVVTGDRVDIQEYCIESGVRALVLSSGTTLDKKLRQKAEDKKISVLISPYRSAETAMLVMYSAPVSTMADAEIQPILVSDTIRRVRPLLQESASRSLPVVDDNRKLVGILAESDLLQDANVEIILVDHNELSQAVEGIENYTIREVVDHHRLGNLTTKDPIMFINRPVGATATIIVSLYRQNRVPIPKEIASILLCAILADTLVLQSATTTDEDRNTAEYLSNITNLDIQALGQDIITAASRIGGRSAGEVVRQDMKEYTEGGHIFTVSQIEVDTPAEILSRKKEFLDELEIECRTRKALFSAMMVTDITKLTSQLLIVGKPSFLQHIEFPRQCEGVYFINDIVSRKKQLLPLLVEQIEQIEGS
ncbi:MAG: putative manganese-dependent inorganic diphosphatase [Spirochaetaceae bacterium]|jgi:manganese-dependent inorganic pyrophosphatase|nr:putative manganese-dependent inorganic diphosphatase [Spirochaetaceae bacterium]